MLTLQINLAAYYCVCDLLLIWQWWYYGKYYQNGTLISSGATGDAPAATETTPLVGGQMEAAQSRLRKAWEQVCESVTGFFNQFTPLQFATFKYMITLGFVIVTGVIAWYSVDESSILADHAALIMKKSPEENPVVLRWDAQLLGWLSALLYIASRIPQIFKNRHTKCAGLSLALFVFAVGGNVTYVLVRVFFSNPVYRTQGPFARLPH